MKAFIYSSILIYVLLGNCLVSVARESGKHHNITDSGKVYNKDKGFDYHKVKVINRSFQVSPLDKLWIRNKYGKIEVKTWAKEEFAILITIKVNASSEQSAIETLNSIHINESKTGKDVQFTTELDEIKRNGWGIFGSSAHQFEINYVINMPSENALQINNQYGNTTLPDYNGVLDYDSAYGNLNAGNLKNESNNIKLRYGNADIAGLTHAVLNFAYSNIKLGKSNDLTINHHYGDLSMGPIDKLNANISYSSVYIESLSGVARIKLRYTGSFKIGMVEPGVKLVNIDANYSSVNLPLSPQGNYDFNVSVNYGNFDYQKSSTKFIHNTATDEHSENQNAHFYEGQVGKGVASGKIIINSHYGDVKF